MCSKALEVRALISSTLLRDIIKVFSASSVSRLLNFILSIITIKKLGAVDYGAFTFGIVVLQSVPQLVDFGLNETTVRFGSEYAENPRALGGLLSHISKIRLLSWVAIIIAGVLFFPLISGIFGKKEVGLAFLLGMIGGAGMLFWNLSLSFYQLTEQFSRVALLNVLYSVLLIAGVLLFFNSGLTAYYWVLGVYVAVPYICSAFSLHPICGILRFKYKVTADVKQKISRFGFWLTLSTVSWIAFRRADVYLLTYFLPLEKVGIYGAALQLTIPVQMLAQTVSNVVLPRVSRMKFVDEFKRFINYSYAFSFLALGGIAFVLALAAPFFFPLLGGSYVKGTMVFRMLLCIPVASSLANLLSYIFLSVNKPEVPSKINMVQGFLNVALSLLLIPFFGMVGASLSVLFTAFLGTFCQVIFARRFLKELLA